MLCKCQTIHRHDIIVIEHWDEIEFSPFNSTSLGVDDMIFISSPLLGLPAPLISVDELVTQRLYRRKEDCCSAKMLSFNLSAIGRDPNEFRNVLLFDDLHTIIGSVCAGKGIAFISKSLVACQLAEGKLLEHKVKGFLHSRKRSLVHRSETLQNQPQSDFITCLRTVIRQA
jgi:LysR family transcriptional regulator, transcriptional activator of the cysJI operon